MDQGPMYGVCLGEKQTVCSIGHPWELSTLRTIYRKTPVWAQFTQSGIKNEKREIPACCIDGHGTKGAQERKRAIISAVPAS